MQLIACVLTNVNKEVSSSRIQDVVRFGFQNFSFWVAIWFLFLTFSFAVTLGIVEQLARCCLTVRSGVHDSPNACAFLLASLEFLTSLAKHCPEDTDPTHLMTTLHGTEFMGVVSMLYGSLLPPDSVPRNEGLPPSPIPKLSLNLALITFKFLKRVAEINLKKFQVSIISFTIRNVSSNSNLRKR